MLTKTSWCRYGFSLVGVIAAICVVASVDLAICATVDVAVGQGGGFTFLPDTVNISVGDTVRWTWAGSGHSVTSGPPCVADSQFCSPNGVNCASGILSNAGTVYQRTFTEPGTYSYHCASHCVLGMTGVVNVSGGCASSGWSAGPNLPSAGARLVGVYFQANGKFYGMGGRSSDSVGSDFNHPFEYDPASNSWTVKSATFPDNEVDDMACGVLVDAGTPYIYCVGGSAAGQSTATGRVFRYDPVTDTIQTLFADNWPGATGTILPGGFAVVINKLYILGGFDINVASTNQIWEFNPSALASSKWTQKVNTPEGVMFAPTASIGGIIYVAGASDFSGASVIDTTHSFSFNPATNTIGAIAAIPRATGLTRALNFNGKMLVMGGGRVAPNPSNEVNIYDPGTNTWTTGSPVPAFATARRNFPTDTDGTTRIWLAGGYDNNSAPVSAMAILCGGATPFVNIPTITAITRLANGHIALHGLGLANATYSVQGSPDLSPNNFVTLGTTSAGWQYDDAGAVGLTKRFYRLLRVPYSVNLIINGNAEGGGSSTTGQPVAVPGWVTASPFTVVPYNSGGGFPTGADPGPPDRLNQFFAGGNGAVSSASQDIDVSGNASDINAGKVTCDLSGWLGGFFTDADNATLTLTFFNGANTLGSSVLGPVTAAQRGNQTGLLLRSVNALQVPPNTTRLHLVLTMTRASGAFNDAYADSLSLVLHVQ